MNFLLEHIESGVDETSFILGEQLLEGGTVQHLKETEKNFWVAEVWVDQRYEVEIKISPSRVIANSCECARYKKEAMCEHIVAVLLQVRQEINNRKSKNAPQETPPPPPPKLTIALILEEIKHEDLVKFVKLYAKQNRNFAIALKTRFAPDVVTANNKEKYLDLLENAIQTSRKADRSFNQRGSQKVLKILEELQLQIEETLLEGYLSESVAMAQSIIERITPLLRKFQHEQEKIQHRVKLAFDVLKSVIEAPAPPALKEAIWDYCIQESRKLVYRNTQIDPHFFRILLHLAEEEARAEQLLEVLDEQIRRYQYENRETTTLLLIRIHLLEKTGKAEDIRRFIQQYIGNPEVLLFAVRQAVSQQQLERAKRLAYAGLEKRFNKKIIAELEEILLQIAQTEKDTNSTIQFAENRLLATLDFQYYQITKAAYTADWSLYFEDLLRTINDLPFSMEKRLLVATIYAEEGMLEQLIAYLKNTQSLDLLKHFTPLLLSRYKAAVYELYHAFFANYLQNHIGGKTSEKISQLLQTLYELGASGIADELKARLRSDFPERHTLMEKLETLQA